MFTKFPCCIAKCSSITELNKKDSIEQNRSGSLMKKCRITGMEVDYRDGSGLQGLKWITGMEVDYRDGSGLQGWKWITGMEVDYRDGSGLQFSNFEIVTGDREIKLSILVED